MFALYQQLLSENKCTTIILYTILKMTLNMKRSLTCNLIVKRKWKHGNTRKRQSYQTYCLGYYYHPQRDGYKYCIFRIAFFTFFPLVLLSLLCSFLVIIFVYLIFLPPSFFLNEMHTIFFRKKCKTFIPNSLLQPSTSALLISVVPMVTVEIHTYEE